MNDAVHPSNRRAMLITALLVSLVISGCAKDREWVAAPTLLVLNGPAWYEQTPHVNRTPDIEVLYVTDRARLKRDDDGVTFGSDRADSMAFGTASVTFSPHMTWEELVAESVNPNRERKHELHVKDVSIKGELRSMTDRLEVVGRQFELPKEAAREVRTEDDELAFLIRERLQHTAEKDVYISVHGLENTFDDAIFRTAEVWHYGGRRGVALAYTWPTGRDGLLGYVYDRESAEFTVSHFKRLLRIVARCDEVQRVHIITHSRGSEVAISALRELHIEARSQKVNTTDYLKLETLVFAAPDMDWQVFRQRFTSELLMNVPRRTVIYFSESDGALSFTEWLFSSVSRLGSLVVEKDFQPPKAQEFASFPGVEFINCEVSGYCSTHDYVFAHPAVLSDLILVVRDRFSARESGRPLERLPVAGVWRIRNNYLQGHAKSDQQPR